MVFSGRLAIEPGCCLTIIGGADGGVNLFGSAGHLLKAVFERGSCPGAVVGVDGPADDLAVLSGVHHRRAVDLACASGLSGGDTSRLRGSANDSQLLTEARPRRRRCRPSTLFAVVCPRWRLIRK